MLLTYKFTKLQE